MQGRRCCHSGNFNHLASWQILFGAVVQVQQIVEMAPRERQTMLFSATMTEDVEQLVRVSLRRPVRLAADLRDTAPSQLAQEIVRLKVGSCSASR